MKAGVTMNYKAVIWDLAGTLLDTLEDLLNSVNYGLEGFGMPAITTFKLCLPVFSFNSSIA